jgi:hypothetical protein
MRKSHVSSNSLPVRVLSLGLLFGGLTAGLAQTGACDLTSFNGAFGYSLSGSVYDTRGYVYLIGAAGRMTSDGAGNLTGADTYSFDGNVAKRQYTGTYTVESDCTGSVTLTTPNGNSTHFDFVLVNDGKEVSLVQSDSGWIVTGSLKKQTQQAPAATLAQ